MSSAIIKIKPKVSEECVAAAVWSKSRGWEGGVCWGEAGDLVALRRLFPQRLKMRERCDTAVLCHRHGNAQSAAET